MSGTADDPGASAVDHRRLHDDENDDFSALLHELSADEWERPSLCEGWLVRDVVGHILYGNELKLWTLPWRLARFGFSSDRSGKHYSIQRAAGRSPQRGSWSWSVQWNWAETRRATGSRKFVIQAQLEVAAACESA